MKKVQTIKGTKDCPARNVLQAILRLADRSGASSGEAYEALSRAFPTLSGEAICRLVEQGGGALEASKSPIDIKVKIDIIEDED
jgi:hypothetical protein